MPDKTQFNGKIGIWPFAENIEAARGSKNRSRSTIEIRGVNASATLFNNMVIKRGGLLDFIMRKLRTTEHLLITIRFDGATLHTGHENFKKIRLKDKRGLKHCV